VRACLSWNYGFREAMPAPRADHRATHRLCLAQQERPRFCRHRRPGGVDLAEMACGSVEAETETELIATADAASLPAPIRKRPPPVREPKPRISLRSIRGTSVENVLIGSQSFGAVRGTARAHASSPRAIPAMAKRNRTAGVETKQRSNVCSSTWRWRWPVGRQIK
jgi:hypothetical protein